VNKVFEVYKVLEGMSVLEVFKVNKEFGVYRV